MKKHRRSMSEISKAITANTKRRPSQKQKDELFDVLDVEGLTEPAKPKRKIAKPSEPEPQI
jgi:hypothetical protein